MNTTPNPAEVRAELEREVRRLADRLRTLTPARLAEAVPGHPSRADAGRGAAQLLADCAARLESAGPLRRKLPVLSDLAVGDQVQVTGTDLLLAAASGPDDQAVEPLVRVLEALRAVRRQI